MRFKCAAITCMLPFLIVEFMSKGEKERTVNEMGNNTVSDMGLEEM